MKTLTAVLLSIALAWCADTPAPDIKIDQAGYLPDAPKIASVVAKTSPAAFTIRDAGTGKVVHQGQLSAAAIDADSGDNVQAADFTVFRKPGKYYLEVAGVGRSWPFEIGPGVYRRAYYLAMRSFYGQRCGTAVDLGPEFPGYRHDACHLRNEWHVSSGKQGTKPASRGWHDAGDYGRYIVNSGISTGTLLWSYEMFGRKAGRVRLNIPESGNGTPDILNEIRWNLDWMLSMQDTDGGVWHKQTSEKFCGFVMPEKDDLVSYIIGTGTAPYKSTCATADFAAVMAIASRVYEPFDRGFAAGALKAAESAWAWVDKNPDILFRNPRGVSTGEYGDRNCTDERLWAAAELWRTTAREPYRKYFLANYEPFRTTIRPDGPPGWGNVAQLGLWTYALAKSGDATAREAIRKDSLAAADQIANRSSKHLYRISLTPKDYIWGSNSVAANYAMQLLVANQMQRNQRYVNAALDNLHYLLGRNTFSLSWVTQVGANPFRHPHHRPSGADANPEPWPGLMAGGPNARKQDPAMRKLPDNLPPARMYLDEQESYATNEIAINWNAPLVFLLASALPD